MLIRRLANRVYAIKRKRDRKKKVEILEHAIYGIKVPLSVVWLIKDEKISRCIVQDVYDSYTIFGTKISLDRIRWHADYISGYEYKKDRFDKINLSQWYGSGVDVKFPWEVSRFYFAVAIAQNYHITRDDKYYYRFKQLVNDWMISNPFLHGVNWRCTMEVALRAVNWVISINIIYEKINSDSEFYKNVIKSLEQHARYIHAFPEIKSDGKGNNHLVADYFGLLFLALSFQDHPDSKEWLEASIRGLEKCMVDQVHNDGTSFEGSIPYHRLVLELFGYAAILCRANNIELSDLYYVKLFKMYEFVAAYVDHNGNAPQIGDNDSGRAIILHQSDEHDHSYLLDMGEHIYDYSFRSQCKKRNRTYKAWLPVIEKIAVIEENL
jgi:hypothetical protein